MKKLVSRVVDQLFKKGAEVVYGSSEAVHVSGHACQEELKLMQTLVASNISFQFMENIDILNNMVN